MAEDQPHADPGAAYVWFNEQPSYTLPYLAPVLMAWLAERRPARVLDLGCGNGALTRHLAEAGHDMTGVDASQSGIDIARRHAPDIPFHQVWLEHPLPPTLQGRFDVVLAAEVIEHLLRPRQLCTRAREALAPKGRLIVTTPYHGYLKNLALAVTGRFDRHWGPLHDGGHVKFFSQLTLSQLLLGEGFQPTRFARVGRIPVFAKSMIMEARMESR